MLTWCRHYLLSYHLLTKPQVNSEHYVWNGFEVLVFHLGNERVDESRQLSFLLYRLSVGNWLRLNVQYMFDTCVKFFVAFLKGLEDVAEREVLL